MRVRLSYDGKEIDTDWASTEQPVEIVGIDLNIMEWVPTNLGHIPIGMQPVEGGYDNDDQRLYHAAFVFDGCTVPGKTGEHLVSFIRPAISFTSLHGNIRQNGAMFPWGGKECFKENDYKIL